MSMTSQTRMIEDYQATIAAMTDSLNPFWDVVDWSDAPLRWRFFRPRGALLPVQGWKIHISTSAPESLRMLKAVTPLLIESQAAFKFPRHLEDIVFLNSGDGGISMLGKIVTIYPTDLQQAQQLIPLLEEVWTSSDGPEVVTDLRRRSGAAVSFRYGIFGKSPVLTDSRGIHQFALSSSDGTLYPDSRDRAPDMLPPDPPYAGVPAEACPVNPGKTFTVDDQRYSALHQISETARATVYLGIDLQSFDSVVIKVGRPGVGGNLSGDDISTQLRREYQFLKRLEPRGVSPRAIGFSADRWPVLITEDIRGTELNQLPREERIQSLPLLAEALNQIHQANLVHGDIKPGNALLSGGVVRLIDFELTVEQGEAGSRGGTRGHIAPEIDGEIAADFSRDIYALAGCVFEAVLGIPPGLLPGNGQQLADLLKNEGECSAAAVIEALTNPDPEMRPGMDNVCRMLREFADDHQADSGSSLPVEKQDTVALQQWADHVARKAGRQIDQYLKSEGNQSWWRNSHNMRHFDCEAINLGAAGILLGLVSIDQACQTDEFSHRLRAGAEWLASRSPRGQAAGLFTGNAGVALALCTIGKRYQSAKSIQAGLNRLEYAALDHRELDLFSGCAGVIWSACLMAEILEDAFPIDMIQPTLKRLNECRHLRKQMPFWSINREREPDYLGCAHGSAGIALAFGALGRQTDDDRLTEQAIDTFYRLARFGKNERGDALKTIVDQGGQYATGAWCHGVAGYLWCILQSVGDHEALRTEIDWAVERLTDSPAVGTPTYCHGLAGQLELWMMLRELPRFQDLAAQRAHRVSKALQILCDENGATCAWVSDDPEVTTPDLWVGFSGPASALAKYSAQITSPLLSGGWLKVCSASVENRDFDSIVEQGILP
ncbi:Serine/threonine-protein kinase PknL [Gimesia chilikensis]|nr:Serine/threonine-protein kinase PknL [Gimesia chilikensis]